MNKLLGLMSGADSKTTARVEQYQETRTTVKSVEITIEHAETTKVEQSILPVFDIGLESLRRRYEGTGADIKGLEVRPPTNS